MTCGVSFDYLVGAGEHNRRNFETSALMSRTRTSAAGLVDHRRFAPEYPIDIRRGPLELIGASGRRKYRSRQQQLNG